MARPGPLRLLVEMESAGDQARSDLDKALQAAGLLHWTVEPLFDDDLASNTDFIVSADLGVPPSPRNAFDLAYLLADQSDVAIAEPDLPVAAYAPDATPVPPGIGAFGDTPPTQDDLDWPKVALHVPDAWARPTRDGTSGRGQGILIGHPDTGYTLHPVFGPDTIALDLVHDYDFVDDDDDGRDPLIKGLIPLTHFAGHGTGTGSIVVGRGGVSDGKLQVTGVLPDATLVPIRAVNSVIQFFDSDVARAVNLARTLGCHVISMSLGGMGFFGLHKAIDKAIDAGMIVLAAAGNDVHIVTAPASYDNCIAVAATMRDSTTWDGSSRGHQVDVSAPGSQMWGAAWAFTDPPTQFTSTKSGTSFAVAHVAGVAGLWLEHHGVNMLRATYPGRRLQAAFRHIVMSGGCNVPANWDSSKYGAGIIDALSVVDAPLPATSELGGVGAFGAAPPSPIARLAAAFGDIDEAGARTRLGSLGLEGAAAERFAPELLYHLLANPTTVESFVTQPDAAAAFAPAWKSVVQARSSTTLAAAIA